MTISLAPTTSISRRGSAGGDPERTVLWVRGEQDISTRASLAGSVACAARCDDVDVLVDLSGVAFMDASSVGVIVESWERLRSRGRSLVVRAPSRPALRVLELCGLAHLIEHERVHATGAAAALGSWVDVRPISSVGEIDPEAARSAARPTTRQPARALVAVDAHVEAAGATVDVDRRGP